MRNLIPLVLVLCVVLSGCSGNPLSQLPWAVNIYSYDLKSQKWRLRRIPKSHRRGINGCC